MACQYQKNNDCKKCTCIKCPYTDRCGHFWECTVGECDEGYPNGIGRCSRKVKKYFKEHHDDYYSSEEIDRAIGYKGTKWYMTKWDWFKIRLYRPIYKIKRKFKKKG